MNNRLEILSAIDPEHAPEGAHPVKQARSRLLRDKVLAHACKLVLDGDFTSASMAGIAHAVGCSVGALYFRFHDKDALFAAAVEVAMAQEVDALQAQVDAGRYRDLPLRETVERCVHDYMDFVRRNENMIRAIYQRPADEPGYWRIVRTAAFKMVQVWIHGVAQAADRVDDPAFMHQAATAFRLVSSSLVYAVLVIGKPVWALGPREHHLWLSEMVMHFIRLDVAETLRHASGRPSNIAVAPRDGAGHARIPCWGFGAGV